MESFFQKTIIYESFDLAAVHPKEGARLSTRIVSVRMAFAR